MTPADLTGRPEQLAPTLLGALLEVHHPGDEVVVARIVEVEAYAGEGEDPGSHAHRGVRPRHAVMFDRPGLLYAYFTYGMHWCANVVCHEDLPGAAGAVLLRAARIESGLASVRARVPASLPDRDVARGPARLTRALGLDGSVNGTDLVADAGSPVRLRPGAPPAGIASGPRVGVSGAGAQTPWRFWDAGAAEVSAYRPAVTRPRRSAPPGTPSRSRSEGAR